MPSGTLSISACFLQGINFIIYYTNSYKLLLDILIMKSLDSVLEAASELGYTLHSVNYTTLSRTLNGGNSAKPKTKKYSRSASQDIDRGFTVYPTRIRLVFKRDEPASEFQKQTEDTIKELTRARDKRYTFNLTLQPYEETMTTGFSGGVLDTREYRQLAKIFRKYGWKVINQSHAFQQGNASLSIG